MYTVASLLHYKYLRDENITLHTAAAQSQQHNSFCKLEKRFIVTQWGYYLVLFAAVRFYRLQEKKKLKKISHYSMFFNINPIFDVVLMGTIS